MRRLAAVKLVELKAATGIEIAAAFGVIVGTLWNWGQILATNGIAELAEETVRENLHLHDRGLSNLRSAGIINVSEFNIHRALKMEATPSAASTPKPLAQQPLQLALPVLPETTDRTCERAAATIGGTFHCLTPAFTPAACIPHAGKFLTVLPWKPPAC